MENLDRLREWRRVRIREINMSKDLKVGMSVGSSRRLLNGIINWS